MANILRANMLTKDWYPIDASLSSSRESTRKTVESIISREKRQDIKQDKANSSTFEMRSLHFMRQALLNEIEARYVASSVSRDKLAQLMKWLRQRI